jgi:hypothetical protein
MLPDVRTLGFLGNYSAGDWVVVPLVYPDGVDRPTLLPDGKIVAFPLPYNMDYVSAVAALSKEAGQPIVVTTAAEHAYQDGMRVWFHNVTGDDGLVNHRHFAVTRIDETHFSLDGTAGAAGVGEAPYAGEIWRVCADVPQAGAITGPLTLGANLDTVLVEIPAEPVEMLPGTRWGVAFLRFTDGEEWVDFCCGVFGIEAERVHLGDAAITPAKLAPGLRVPQVTVTALRTPSVDTYILSAERDGELVTSGITAASISVYRANLTAMFADAEMADGENGAWGYEETSAVTTRRIAPQTIIFVRWKLTLDGVEYEGGTHAIPRG